jgi:hypothetical protein
MVGPQQVKSAFVGPRFILDFFLLVRLFSSLKAGSIRLAIVFPGTVLRNASSNAVPCRRRVVHRPTRCCCCLIVLYYCTVTTLLFLLCSSYCIPYYDYAQTDNRDGNRDYLT